MNNSATFCHIDQHQLLLVTGPDAKKFLQGQVTCDINLLSGEQGKIVQSTLGAHCTHKGRIVFSFRALQLAATDTDELIIALYIPNDIAEIAIAALKKYSVFSKVTITNAREQYTLLGIYGSDLTTAIPQYINDTSSIPIEPNTALHSHNGTIICLNSNRYELWLKTDQAARFLTQLNDQPLANNPYWDTLTIQSGIAEIHALSSGLFTPHDINYHQTGSGVSFSKGCYTGQEVVARMQYLGKLKRQLYLFTLDNSNDALKNFPKAGDSVYTSEKTQSVGDIVAISSHDQTIYLLASVIKEHAETAPIFIDIDYQKPLTLLAIDS